LSPFRPTGHLNKHQKSRGIEAEALTPFETSRPVNVRHYETCIGTSNRTSLHFMGRRKVVTPRRGCMKITAMWIHGMEQSFVCSRNESLKNWKRTLRSVRADAQRLRIKAQELFAQQNGMKEWMDESITMDTRDDNWGQRDHLSPTPLPALWSDGCQNFPLIDNHSMDRSPDGPSTDGDLDDRSMAQFFDFSSPHDDFFE
jgi:hypothetical protein